MISRPTGLSALAQPILPLPDMPPAQLDSNSSSSSGSFNEGLLRFPHDPSAHCFTSKDLDDRGEVGHGNFGCVNRMVHRATGREIAVKRIRSHTLSPKEQKRMLTELNTVVMAQKCDFIVKFHGAIFCEGDCWICMELMDISMDKLYKRAFDVHASEAGEPFGLTEKVLWHVAVSTIRALIFLKKELRMIHRDVKPSNILLCRAGSVKLCDFGIAGQLVDSIAQTQDTGCRPYLAPERVENFEGKYDTRSDIWSLGISLFEMATGRFPYKTWHSPFEQLTAVVHGAAPVVTLQDIPDGADYTTTLLGFINSCLVKERSSRPKYDDLIQHAFFLKYEEAPPIEEIRAETGRLVDRLLPHRTPEETLEATA